MSNNLTYISIKEWWEGRKSYTARQLWDQGFRVFSHDPIEDEHMQQDESFMSKQFAPTIEEVALGEQFHEADEEYKQMLRDYRFKPEPEDGWARSIVGSAFNEKEQKRLNKEATERLTERGWSPAETPAGRKLMKEGDSPFHFDSNKPRMEQLPPRAILAVTEVFTYGAKKYGDHNWARYAGEWQWGQLIGSTLRHIFAWMKREDLDRESGLPHLDHAAANLLMLIELILAGNNNDDRNPIKGV